MAAGCSDSANFEGERNEAPLGGSSAMPPGTTQADGQNSMRDVGEMFPPTMASNAPMASSTTGGAAGQPPPETNPADDMGPGEMGDMSPDGERPSNLADQLDMVLGSGSEPTEPPPDDEEPDDPSTDDPADEPSMGDAGAGAEPQPVPMTDHCAAVADWDAEWVQWEQEVLLLVNEARSEPRSCGSQGDFDATEPLSDNPLLTCSARLHSLDMFERDFFDHVNPDGVEPSERVTEAGYEWMATGENIAYGYDSPQAVVEGWLDSDGHCSNIMNDIYEEIGIGYYPGNLTERFSSDRHYWTQNFGTERGEGGFGPGGGFGGFGN